uniref:Secreted protein n=1 Tax=Triticum urartu TaxID=4572 RepID=A0A8R7PX52_TRIUA
MGLAKVLCVLNLLFHQSPWILLLLVFQCSNLPALYDNPSVSLPTQANEQELVYHSCFFIFTYNFVVIQKDGHLTLLVDVVKVLLDHDPSLGKTFAQSKCDSSDLRQLEATSR